MGPKEADTVERNQTVFVTGGGAAFELDGGKWRATTPTGANLKAVVRGPTDIAVGASGTIATGRTVLQVCGDFSHRISGPLPRNRHSSLSLLVLHCGRKWAGADSNCGYGHPKAEGYQATPPARR